MRVRLFEMKPVKFSPAHQSPFLAELVCSNSLRAEGQESAVGLLKEEMRRLNSLIMAAALATRVPAGKALAVDRGAFAAYITQALEAEPLIEIVREEVEDVALDRTTVLATGPLDRRGPGRGLGHGLPGRSICTSTMPSRPLWPRIPSIWARFSGPPATGPGRITSIVPFSEAEYAAFYQALTSGEQVPLQDV